MLRPMQWILAGACLAVELAGHAAELPRVGIVESWNFDKSGRSVPYQQTVWRHLLDGSRMFATEVVDDAALEDPAALRGYGCLVLPSSRFVLTGAQMTNLAQFVLTGGKLIRDQQAVTLLGRLGETGWETDASPAARAAVAAFWREVGGVGDGERLLVRDIRFLPERGVLAEFLPETFTPVEALCDVEFEPFRQAVAYRLAGAQAVAEARPDAEDGGGTAPPQAVVALRQCGSGQCLSLGINVRGLTGLRSPMAMYRDFMANLRFWIVEESGATRRSP